jgi:hypothetical protein
VLALLRIAQNSTWRLKCRVMVRNYYGGLWVAIFGGGHPQPALFYPMIRVPLRATKG